MCYPSIHVWPKDDHSNRHITGEGATLRKTKDESWELRQLASVEDLRKSGEEYVEKARSFGKNRR